MGEKRRIMNAGHTHTHTHLDVKGFIFSHPLSRDLHPIWTVEGGGGRKAEGEREEDRGEGAEKKIGTHVQYLTKLHDFLPPPTHPVTFHLSPPSSLYTSTSHLTLPHSGHPPHSTHPGSLTLLLPHLTPPHSTQLASFPPPHSHIMLNRKSSSSSANSCQKGELDSASERREQKPQRVMACFNMNAENTSLMADIQGHV